MLTVTLALAAPFVGFAGAYLLIAQFYFRNPEMRTFATYLILAIVGIGAAVTAVLLVVGGLALSILIGGAIWMLAIKLAAWTIGLQISWTLSFGIGAALTMLSRVVRPLRMVRR